ncbi:MAG TPA: ImmA/IrrE family metallo-endopeptidase [Candidatus Paceibacterota bacterium]|mgnify:CR=1 FL=1|nr:ImmA/IrrE family metallo-endopeptidase [Candidatus Paceibacterota bacterium]HMO83199.1 ImmA/IrrE family metallo-endopeptidase [Candidatus Paceibacterota bacterium]
MALTPTSKKAIETIATNLLKSAGQDSVPINLKEIAKLVGLKVELFPFPDEIDGLLKKEMAVIGINEHKHPRRQRFTLAHEIGHYVLGHSMNVNNDLIDDHFTDSTSATEREANFFASVLLMPAVLIKESCKKDINIKKLAEEFEVSEQAMTIRVLELGLI